MKEKPFIDREEEIRRDRIRQRARQSLARASALLAPGEAFGRPFREGAVVILPVEPDAPVPDPPPAVAGMETTEADRLR